MKGLFPKVDPTELLDVLTSNCYNVKDACEELSTRGHSKKDSSLTPPKLKEERKPVDEKLKEVSLSKTPRPSPSVIRPKNLTEDYKKRGKNFFVNSTGCQRPKEIFSNFHNDSKIKLSMHLDFNLFKYV